MSSNAAPVNPRPCMMVASLAQGLSIGFRSGVGRIPVTPWATTAPRRRVCNVGESSCTRRGGPHDNQQKFPYHQILVSDVRMTLPRTGANEYGTILPSAD